MSIELAPATPEHFETLSQICHRAFNSLHEHHRVPPAVPTEDVGRLIILGVLFRDDYVGVVAFEDGRVVGSNFILLADDVCGLGPITVDPNVQSRGVGRRLMQWAVDEARARRGNRVDLRLFQEAVNVTSLSLYASVGFDWRDSAALMTPVPATSDDDRVRPLRSDDLPHVERLSARQFGSSRANDTRQLLKMELPAFVLERDGKVVAYHVATLFGHAAAETDHDLISLAAHTARHVPPQMSVVIVPMSRPSLFRKALAAQWRVEKVLNCMSLGSYRAPPGGNFPSIQC